MSRLPAERLHRAYLWCLAAIVVRLAWIAYQPPVQAWDGQIYARTAVRIAQGLGFVDTWNNLPPYRPTAFYPVGFPATLAAAYSLTGSLPVASATVQIVAAAVSTACVVWLARRLLPPAGVHLAAALSALAPGGVLYAATYMTEPLSACLLALAVVALVRGEEDARARWPFLAGLLLGLGALVRPPALLVAPVLALASPRPTPARRLVLVALVGLSAAAPVVPWTLRNCRVLDACAVVSVNGGSNLWIGTDPDALGGYRDLRPGEGCDRVHGEVAKDRCYGALAIRRIREHPLAWLSLVPMKLGQMLAFESSPVSYLRAATNGARFGGNPAVPFALLTAAHLSLLALAMLGLSRAPHPYPPALRLPVAATIALLGVHAVFFGADRYHFVFAPFLALAAGHAVLPPRVRPPRPPHPHP